VDLRTGNEIAIREIAEIEARDKAACLDSAPELTQQLPPACL